MLTIKEKLPAKATTKLGLAMTAAALWMATAPFTGAAAAGPGSQVDAARAAAIRQCNVLANRSGEHDWGNRYRSCMAEQNQQE